MAPKDDQPASRPSEPVGGEKTAPEQQPEAAAPDAPAAVAANTTSSSSDVEEKNPAPGPGIVRSFFIFFELLFAANPTWTDIALIIFGALCATGAGVPFPVMGVLFGELVDDFNSATCAANDGSSEDAFRYEAAINDKVIKTAWIGVIALSLIYFYLTSWSIASQRLAQRLRNQYVAALLRQPPAFFDTRGSSGQVSTRLQGDITAVQAGTSEKVGVVIMTISFITTVFVIAFSRQPALAGMLLSMLPVFLLSGILGGRYWAKFSGLQNDATASASSIASEALSHVQVVQAFGAAPRLQSAFMKYMTTARQHAIRKGAIGAVQTGVLYFVAYSGNALAFWQGSIRIADTLSGVTGGASIGQIYAIVYLLIDACIMLGGLAPLLPFLGGAVAAYRRLLEDIETPSDIDGTSDTGRVLPPGGPKTIRFENVSFEYPSRPGHPVLKTLSIEFPAGKYTAIVGLSGSGKSTIASLIARLHDPTEGAITLDGQDLRGLNVRSLRSLMTFVQQMPSLFDSSILENIALGLVNSPHQRHQHLKPFLAGPQLAELAAKGKDALTYASSHGPEIAEIAELVRLAAEQADAAVFINGLGSGYGTSVGPKGTLLSGGQRQRVALAQALIRDPQLLILDEATASVDSASEHRIQIAVERAASENRTIISIAHRLSTIRSADNIIVLQSGEIVEQGTYAALMAIKNGKFAEMARLQKVSTTGAGAEVASISSSSLDPTVDKADGSINEKTEDGQAVKKTKTKDEESKADEEKDVVQPARGTWKSIAWLARPSVGWLLLALFAATIVGATFSASGVIFGYTVGALNPCQSTMESILSMGKFFAGLIFMVAVVELFANFLAWWGFGIIGERILYSLRILSFRSLLEQGLPWHQSDGRTPTRLLSIITKDCTSIGAFSSSTFGTVFAICINVVIAIVLSHILAWKIALVALVTIPILLGAGVMQLRMLARYEERHQEAFTMATSLATEAIESIQSVASLSLENTYITSYKRLLGPASQEVLRAAATTNILLAISHTAGTFINALIYWWGSQLIMKGEYTQTQLLIILVAMLTSAQLWGSMFTLAPEFSRARLALARVMGVVNIGSSTRVHETGSSASGSDVEASGEAKQRDPKNSFGMGGVKVEFQNVSFAYPTRPDVPILDGVSFTIAPGQFYGLVGPSGAGKSTIMNLAQRFYEPSAGSILIDDKEIQGMPASFRDSIALVPQDPALFDGTVRYNVGLGALPGYDATDAEIEEACRLANIHEEIIALPDGYDTECGASASRLSGGQRQRVAIARALVRRPRLLLLDESTSALDAASEAALQEGLERASRGTTVLAITHRLHTVQKADMILVVEGGQIVESGRHAELMDRSELYRLNAMQQMLH